MADLPFPTVGDAVAYTRRTDGRAVAGRIVSVYYRGQAPDTRAVPLWTMPQLADEYIAFRLRLRRADAARVAHPVTLGESRIEGVLREEHVASGYCDAYYQQDDGILAALRALRDDELGLE